MKVVRIIAQIGILWIYYFIGMWIVELTGIIIPGSIIGLVLLWLSLYFKLLKIAYIQDGATFLLAMLTLFFIPATVAIIDYPELLTAKGLYLMGGIIISTMIAIAIAGRTSKWLENKEQGGTPNASNNPDHH